MITYQKYLNNRDHCWYDSSNVLYSECYDNNGPTKNIKVVFNGGRTYMYHDVTNDDYIAFRMAESNGKALNSILKRYECARLMDTDLAVLEEKKNSFINESQEVMETPVGNLFYTMKYNDMTGDVMLCINDKPIFNGVEGSVSIINLFKSMGINYTMMPMSEDDKALLTESRKDD